jgi:hypothetical protein
LNELSKKYEELNSLLNIKFFLKTKTIYTQFNEELNKNENIKLILQNNKVKYLNKESLIQTLNSIELNIEGIIKQVIMDYISQKNKDYDESYKKLNNQLNDELKKKKEEFKECIDFFSIELPEFKLFSYEIKNSNIKGIYEIKNEKEKEIIEEKYNSFSDQVKSIYFGAKESYDTNQSIFINKFYDDTKMNYTSNLNKYFSLSYKETGKEIDKYYITKDGLNKIISDIYDVNVYELFKNEKNFLETNQNYYKNIIDLINRNIHHVDQDIKNTDFYLEKKLNNFISILTSISKNIKDANL